MDHRYGTNPILKMDYPDPDVIFVNNTFYMISTTMHYMPGAEILRSYDLINWEHAAFVYDRLDGTESQKLVGEGHIYGKGMWAASLRYHAGMFYVIFACNDTHKTYLYRSETIEGEWAKSTIDGFYHDCSLLFDDDRAYLVHGNTDIYLTELTRDMKGPLEGGLHRILVSDVGNPMLGYEGSHFYKIKGRYYLFLIHSARDKWMRRQAAFSAPSLTDEFVGGDVLSDDMGRASMGVAQGGIVDDTKGNWHAVLFQDCGAVGRIPVTWNGHDPVFGNNGKVPKAFLTQVLRRDNNLDPLYGSDDFKENYFGMENPDKKHFGCFGLKSFWQFSHEPDLNLVNIDKENGILEFIFQVKGKGTELLAKKNVGDYLAYTTTR